MISVIVPVLNERENIAPLLGEILETAKIAPISEILYVDDGSTDGSADVFERLAAGTSLLRVLRHSGSFGQSAAFTTGARNAHGELLVFLDGDGQNRPADIVRLFERYRDHRGSTRIAVLGQRKKRQDNWLRRFSSRAANRIRSALLKDDTRDTGCSLKLVRREDFLRLPYFDHMHRFLPALLMRDGVTLLHVDVGHRQRERGRSKYGFWDRLWAGLIDLCGVMWLCARRYPKELSCREVIFTKKKGVA